MRFDNGKQALEEVALHLTTDEARQLVGELSGLIEQMEFPGFEHNLGGLGLLELNLYSDAAGLDEGFAARVQPDASHSRDSEA
jgi:hypothetical protein